VKSTKSFGLIDSKKLREFQKWGILEEVELDFRMICQNWNAIIPKVNDEGFLVQIADRRKR
jgi:hypothetical protein